MNEKPTNPKDAAASNRLPLHLVPDTLPAFAALAFTEGAAKYGSYNWRRSGVSATVYVDASRRHIAKWLNGEDRDPKTGVPHLASAIASLAVILDAQVCGKLTDDRPPPAPVAELIDLLAEDVARIRSLFPARP